jgi:hypothetical protein
MRWPRIQGRCHLHKEEHEAYGEIRKGPPPSIRH